MENDIMNVNEDVLTVSEDTPEGASDVMENEEYVESDDTLLPHTCELEPEGEDEDKYAYYRRLAESDLLEIKREFIDASELSDITELDNPGRFCELRELGLSPKEAYLATQRKRADTRSHLKSRVPTPASAPKLALTQKELESARELFAGISDAEIQQLYKKVSR